MASNSILEIHSKNHKMREDALIKLIPATIDHFTFEQQLKSAIFALKSGGNYVRDVLYSMLNIKDQVHYSALVIYAKREQLENAL